VAPLLKLTQTGSEVGHINMLDGRPGLLGGELVHLDERTVQRRVGKRKHRTTVKVTVGIWELNDDSGRYGHKHESVTEDNLRAAAELLLAVGLKQSDVDEVQLKTRKLLPLHLDPHKSDEAAEMKRCLALGGYVLKPNKEGTLEDLPEALRTEKGAIRWGRRARFRLGELTEADRSWRERRQSYRRKLRQRAGRKPR
jgi:hypothetical protein